VGSKNLLPHVSALEGPTSLSTYKQIIVVNSVTKFTAIMQKKSWSATKVDSQFLRGFIQKLGVKTIHTTVKMHGQLVTQF